MFADYDTPESRSQETIQYHDPEEPVLNEEEIEHLQSEDSESTRQYDSEFVQFDGDYFVLIGHKSAAFSIIRCQKFPEVLLVLSQERKEDTQIGSCDYSSDLTAVC